MDHLAQTLRDEGVSLWLDDQHSVVDAITKVEQSWALRQTPDIAIQLGVMYDRVNRHQDALAVYREASHLFLHHPRLRHEAGITLLRHGQPEDIRAFFDSLRRLDPEDAFARFASEMLDAYRSWTTGLAQAIKAQNDAKEVYLFACAVWGESYTGRFVKHLCASLLAPNNFPALARDHAIHFAILTTAESEARLRADPIFQQLLPYATFHFVHYETSWLGYAEAMSAHYGSELGLYYARTCRFLLFCAAHYTALSVGRTLGCNVVPLCADLAYSDGAFTEVARRMRDGADVVAYWNCELEGEAVQRLLEDRFRDECGRLVIPREAFPRLFLDHMSSIYDGYFVDSPAFSSFPVHLLWRAGPNAVVVHATHCHPLCVRPSALAPPFELTIDPVDSRFLDKRFTNRSRIHFVRDLSIASFTLDETLPVVNREPRTMSVRDVGLWLWGYWGPWRGVTFEAPVVVVDGKLTDKGERTRQQARATAAAIIAQVERLEEGNRRRKSWVLTENVTRHE